MVLFWFSFKWGGHSKLFNVLQKSAFLMTQICNLLLEMLSIDSNNNINLLYASTYAFCTLSNILMGSDFGRSYHLSRHLHTDKCDCVILCVCVCQHVCICVGVFVRFILSTKWRSGFQFSIAMLDQNWSD